MDDRWLGADGMHAQDVPGRGVDLFSEKNQPIPEMPESQAGPGASSLAGAWAGVIARIRPIVGDGPFNAWIRNLRPEGIDAGTLRLAIRGKACRKRVEERYASTIHRLVREALPEVTRVQIVEDAEGAADPASPGSTAPAAPVRAKTQALAGGTPPPVAARLSSGLDQRLTFSSFVVGETNFAAQRAGRRVAEGPHPAHNPLYVSGPNGCGKTHILHAIGNAIQEARPGDKVLFLPVERFVYLFVSAIKAQRTLAFKEALRDVQTIIIDDFHLIDGKQASQTELFHTFRDFIDAGKQIVVAADRRPVDLTGIDETFRMRLFSGLTIEIEPADLDLRRDVLRRWATDAESDGGVPIAAEVLDYLAARVSSSMRELEGAFNRLQFHARDLRKEVTMELAEQLTVDIVRAKARRVSVEQIQRTVADHFGLSMEELLSRRRTARIARPRQVAMWLSKELTPRSYPDIGQRFGGRDHTTIMYGVRKIEDLRAHDTTIREATDILRRRLCE